MAQSPMVARVLRDSPIFDDTRPIATLPAGTVLPYIGVASGAMRAVVARLDAESCIVYISAQDIALSRAS